MEQNSGVHGSSDSRYERTNLISNWRIYEALSKGPGTTPLSHVENMRGWSAHSTSVTLTAGGHLVREQPPSSRNPQIVHQLVVVEHPSYNLGVGSILQAVLAADIGLERGHLILDVSISEMSIILPQQHPGRVRDVLGWDTFPEKLVPSDCGQPRVPPV